MKISSLYKSENYTVYSRIYNETGAVFVSFMFRNTNPQPFGEEVFQKYELNAIHVMCRGPHWYQYPDSKEVAEAILKAAQSFSPVVTYGTSMGGYAALMFSKAVDADVVVSCSPQFSVDPEKVPFEDRWRDDVESIRKEGGFVADCMAEGITRRGKVVIVYDPYDVDRKHVELVRKIRDISDLIVPVSKHRSLGVLAEMGLASKMLRSAAQGDLDIQSLRHEIRARRYKSPTYLRYLAREFEQKKRPGIPVLLEHAAATTKPDDYHSINGNFRLLLRNGPERLAAEQLLLLLGMELYMSGPQLVREFSRYASILIQEGIGERAEALLRSQSENKAKPVIARNAGLMLAWLWKNQGETDKALGWLFSVAAKNGLPSIASDLAYFLDEIGQTEAAVNLWRLVLVETPDCANTAYLLSDRLQRLGRLDEALAVYDALNEQGYSIPNEPHRLRYAQLLLQTARHEEALRQCDLLLGANPLHVAGHRVRGNALAKMKRHAEAREAFLSSLKLDPSNDATKRCLDSLLRTMGEKA